MSYILRLMAPMEFPSRFERALDAALATGTLTTIATGGALLGLGWREGEAGRAFRLAGRGLLERIGVASQAAPLTSVALGYLHHLVIATAWGFLLGAIVMSLRGVWRILVTAAVVLGYASLSLSVLPAPLRIGYGVTGTTPGAVPIAAALAVALLSSIWLDASHTSTASQSDATEL
ncbi:MAG: hypothetical protein IBJ03_07270 [Gemmatimonadaceae bacterium]|nr:hypothetical protein [Gemmatimonadaceae bacterium]